jgi:hypothetical protein
MSLDGFIAGPGHAMDWVFDFVAPDEFPDIAAATGAMLIGRRTYEVGKRGVETASRGKISGEDYGGGWSGPEFVLTHRSPLGEGVAAVGRLSGAAIPAGVVGGSCEADDGGFEFYGWPVEAGSQVSAGGRRT